MKNYAVLFLVVFTLFACSVNDNDNFHFEYIPVVTVDVPSEFERGQTYRLGITYELPSSCYSFYNYDYLYEDASRIIAAYAMVNDSDPRTLAIIEGEFFILVEALQTEPYIFKFWQGEDEQGEPIYLTIEVPVI